MKFIIKIDKESIKENPNAGSMMHKFASGPPKIEETYEVLFDGSRVLKNVRKTQPIQTIRHLNPEGPYLFDYLPTTIKCDYCGAEFDYKELSADCNCDSDGEEIWSNEICPKCGTWGCCEIEYEKIEKLKEEE